MNMSVQGRGQVVVGLDGDPRTAATARIAGAEAERLGTGLAVVTVLPARSAAGVSLEAARLARRRLEADALQDVHAVAAELHHAHPNLEVTTYVLDEDEISSEREPLQWAQLLVIGTPGDRPRAELLTGLSPRLLLQHGRCAVLAVPDHQAGQRGDLVVNGGRARIVVAVSEDPFEDTVVRAACCEALARGAELVLLHAYSCRPGESDEQARARAVQVVERSAAMVPPALSAVVAVTEDDPVSALVRRSLTAEMLVIGGRHGALSGHLPGSVSHAVLRGAHCTVLAVPRDQTRTFDLPLVPATPTSRSKVPKASFESL